jgi:hypothetical protein
MGASANFSAHSAIKRKTSRLRPQSTPLRAQWRHRRRAVFSTYRLSIFFLVQSASKKPSPIELEQYFRWDRWK